MSLTRPREPIRRRVVLLAAAYAFLVLLHRSAEATSLSLFLDHLGAKKLPLTFLVVSLVDVPLAFGYMHLARRANRRGMMVGLGAVLVTLLVGSRLVGLMDAAWGLFSAYLAATSLGTFLVIHWGVLLLDAFSVDESRRAFPFVYAGGHVGSFVAGAAMQLAGTWRALDLLVAIPGLSLLGLSLMMVVLGREREGLAVRQERTLRPGAAAGPSAIRNLGLLAASPLIRIVAASTALMVLLRLCLRYLYGHELEDAFSGPEALTRFVGVYTMIASVAGLSLQLFATPRLLRSMGVGKLNLAYAAAVFVSLLGLAGAPGVVAATAARFTDLELKGAIKTPLSAMFYDALGFDQRADARAIVLGIVSPIASLGSSLTLLVFTRMQAPVTLLAWASMGLALVYLLFSAMQAGAYRRSLENQLVHWAQHGNDELDITVDRALELARSCRDPRIVDMAKEVRRRRTS